MEVPHRNPSESHSARAGFPPARAHNRGVHGRVAERRHRRRDRSTTPDMRRNVYEYVSEMISSVWASWIRPPDLVADDASGLPAYSALHLRIIDKVRDRRRANPFGALLRLETRMPRTAW